MAGLVGMIANRPAGVLDRSELDRLIAGHAALHGASDHQVLEFGDRGAVAAMGGALPTTVERRGDSWGACAGRVQGLKSLASALPGDLDGQFALVTCDGEGTVAVTSDPMGMYPFFTAERDGVTYFGTSLLPLVRHLRLEPSRVGVAAFLLSGYQFGRPTVWHDVERLDPAVRIVFDEQGRREERYWRPDVDPSIDRLTMTQAVDRCIDVAVEVLAAYFRGSNRLWIDFTGGFDSRLLALLLVRAGIAFEGTTVGVADQPDVVIAADLARRTAWPWRWYQLPQDWPEQSRRFATQALAAGNGHLDVMQLAEVLCANAEKSTVRPDLLAGGGGETYRHYAWAQEFLRAGRSTVVNMENWIDMRMLGSFDPALLARDIIPAVRADFARRMHVRAHEYANRRNTTQLEAMYAYKVMGHFGAYAAASADSLRVQLPYYFKPLYTSAFSVPWRYRNWHRFQRAMIARLDPAVAAVPTERGGPAEPWSVTNFHRFAPYYHRQLRGVIPKLSQRVIGRRLLAEDRRLPPLAAAGRRAVLDEARLDVSKLRSASLYDATALRALLAEAADPAFDRWPVVGRIVTIELSLRTADATLDATAG